MLTNLCREPSAVLICSRKPGYLLFMFSSRSSTVWPSLSTCLAPTTRWRTEVTFTWTAKSLLLGAADGRRAAELVVVDQGRDSWVVTAKDAVGVAPDLDL